MELVSLVYGLTSQLPDVERFGLKAQIQRLIEMLYKIDIKNVLVDLGSVQRKIGAFTNKLKSE